MVELPAELTDADRSLFPGNFTLRALRDSRYHNTAYAIAELIDNSIEAGAEQIDLLCMEHRQVVTERERSRVSQLAILDNGTGMDMMTLLEALKFGGGTRHDAQRSIGKYGMGLPTSSMSQCKRVDVWTWQNGLDSVLHSSIDADEIEQGDFLVPIPDPDTPIPVAWRSAGNDAIYTHQSGTLVVWSKLDKIQWRTGSTIIDNTSREIGRIHRHFVDEEIVKIRAASFHENRPRIFDYEKYVVANDPLYLMGLTSTPEPWDKKSMFMQWCPQRDYKLTVGGKESTIVVKYSIVKPEALQTDRPTQNPGETDRGRHARHNIGVSVVREDREIIPEDAFLREGGSADNPQNRWWGCEVLFRRDCDDLFGVDHNKQMAANFTQAARTFARDDRTNQDILDELGLEEDTIYEIVGDIRDQTRAMMREIRLMFEQRRGGKNDSSRRNSRRDPESQAAQTATDADRDAIAAGEETPTDTDKERDSIAPEDRVAGLAKQLVESGHAKQEAEQLATRLVQENLSYQFIPVQLDGSQMFRVRTNQGIIQVQLNTDHSVYDLLRHIEGRLDEDGDENDPAYQSIVAIRLLLSSWARMEDQTESRQERTRIQDIAIDWGRQVDKVISRLREREG